LLFFTEPVLHFESAEATQALATSNITKYVIRAVLTYTQSSQIQSTGVRILCDLVTTDSYMAGDDNRLDAVDAVMLAMRRVSRIANTQATAAVFLRSVAKSQTVVDHMVKNGVVDALLTALSIHSENVKVVQCVLVTLSALTGNGIRYRVQLIVSLNRIPLDGCAPRYLQILSSRR
jgi:osmotically-inducible protein OsmY